MAQRIVESQTSVAQNNGNAEWRVKMIREFVGDWGGELSLSFFGLDVSDEVAFSVV